MCRVKALMLPFLLALFCQPAGASDWRLAGSISGEHPAALVASGDTQRRIKVGETLNNCTLVSVSPKRASFDCGDERRVLRLGAAIALPLPAEQKLSAHEGDPVVLRRNEVHARMADRQVLVSELPLEPLVDKRGIAGYRLLAVRSNSLAARAGFRAGDVLRAVNGVPTNSGSAFAGLLNELGDARQVLIAFERDGVPQQTLVLLQ